MFVLFCSLEHAVLFVGNFLFIHNSRIGFLGVWFVHLQTYHGASMCASTCINVMWQMCMWVCVYVCFEWFTCVCLLALSRLHVNISCMLVN